MSKGFLEDSHRDMKENILVIGGSEIFEADKFVVLSIFVVAFVESVMCRIYLLMERALILWGRNSSGEF